jgi:radical SAM superfamily enzyme YgiQ (UPF0313 family)
MDYRNIPIVQPFNPASSEPMSKQHEGGFVSRQIALIAAPWIFQEEAEFQSQQLGLAYVGSYIIECGHRIAAYIDPMLDGGHEVIEPIQTRYQIVKRVGHTDEWIIEQISSEVEFIFFNAPFTDSRICFYRLCNKVKDRYPDKIIVVGGILATTLPHQIMTESKADIVVKGEGEIAAGRILNGDSLSDIPGILFRGPMGDVHENDGRSEQLVHVDDIPWITRHDFRPMEKYLRWSPRGNKANRTFSYISSRGCPFTCEFCSIPEKGQRWRPFSVERTISEINFMLENYQIDHIEFEDDNFTLNADHSLPVLQHIANLRKKGIDISCSFPNGIMIDRMDREHAFALKNAGTEVVYLPVESGHLKGLIAMNKPQALEHLDKTLEVAGYCAEAGLRFSAFFIVAYPGGRVVNPKYISLIEEQWPDHIITRETETAPNGATREVVYLKGEDRESFEVTLSFAEKLRNIGASAITPLIATPYPGTAMADICSKFDWLRYGDASDIVATVSYANPKDAYVAIETPWCSASEAFDRWREMSALFPTLHNVRKSEVEDRLLFGEDFRHKTSHKG